MIRRKDTEEARKFWVLVDQAAKKVDTWPTWKRMSMMNPPVVWSDKQPEDINSKE